MSKAKEQIVSIPAPNIKVAQFRIIGTAPFVQHRFGTKAKAKMKAQQEAGSAAKKGRKREPKDFEQCYKESMYESANGRWRGINAACFRNAMVSACRIVGFAMTRAKLAVFILADGFDRHDGTPLVKIVKGKPTYHEMPVRNETGVADIRARAMWLPGWEANLRIEYDADMFVLDDIANLLTRVGKQVGIGEGRPDSKKSCGLGWGLFKIGSSGKK